MPIINTRQPIKLATLVNMDRLHRKVFTAFSVSFFVWITSLMFYAIVKLFTCDYLYVWATDVVTWTFIVFVGASVITVYFSRILYDSLVPIVLKLHREMENCTTKHNE